MSVTKYRSVDEMPPPDLAKGADLAVRIRAVWQRSRRIAPPAFTAGVHKFRNLDAAQAAREQETRVRALRIKPLARTY